MSPNPVDRLRLDRVRWGRVALVGAAAVTLAALCLLGGPGARLTSTAGGGSGLTSQAEMFASSASEAGSTLATSPAVTTSALQLGVAVTPSAICVAGDSSCSAGTDQARVTLTADAEGLGTLSWPAVEVAFVIETTVYDGVYDPVTGAEPGEDPCANAGGDADPCESSNGVPFFTVQAQSIANAIAANNPHSQVSFAMVDYFATNNDWNDGDGVEYHVDVATFVPSSEFGNAVHQTFQQEVLQGHLYYQDSDFADNFLHSSSITALYGTIVGSGLNWQANTHHVIVWMGSSAPRDPNYPENYCVSAHNGAPTPYGMPCDGGTCEPSYAFPTGASPNCEGWVKSQDGNASHSISELAKTAKQCTDSIGGVCTVDTIDLWDTATDPYSEGWPAAKAFVDIGGGPGGRAVVADVTNILNAGCDLAAATGGTWDGPAFWTCPDGQAGTLQYVPHGSYNAPNTQNPTLFNALKDIGFGPVLNTQIAASTGHPIFSYVPIGNIQPSTNLQATAACLRDGNVFRTCQTVPTVVHSGALTYLAWNWSTNKTTNTMFVGDSWTASFNVIAVGPPYQTVPVDACTTQICKTGGSGPVGGLYTWATYVPASNVSTVTQSFPLGTVHVETNLATPLGVAPPPPPPVPPGVPLPTPPALPVVTQIGVTNTLGIGQVSLQATAAGFLGAGFLRVSLKNKPMAVRVAAKSGKVFSKFEAEAMSRSQGVGRFV